MEKVKNALNYFKEQFKRKTAVQSTEVVNEQPVVDEVIVSDYAVAQGAAHKQPNGDEVHDRYNWLDRTGVAELYHPDKDGRQVPTYHQEPVGMAPVFADAFANRLAVRGNYLTYRENGQDEYVYFPQKRVTGKLADDLTILATGKFKVPESEFGPLSYVVKQYGNEIRADIQNACYYYQGRGYCVRVVHNQQNTTVQWFELRPVVAKRVEDQIQCEDQLLADFYYREDKVRADLQNSVTVEREIPKMYTKTPVPHVLDQREIERVH